jgi:hypothetical protein
LTPTARSASRLALALLLAVVAGTAGGISIHSDGASFRVAGWQAGDAPPGGWGSVFTVHAGEGDVPPLLGAYAVENGTLIFRPRFPVSPGVRVHARFRSPNGDSVEAVFDREKKPVAPNVSVKAVYPTTDLLPENQLKFYIEFTGPMSRGEAWQHIRLLDRNGDPVDLPFLEIDQELWNRGQTRLTVLFDPGRIKRGVLPLEEAGPAIEDGGRYTLVIDRNWRDAGGAPLKGGYRKTFRVGSPDRDPPDPKTWRITPPRAGTRQPLVVDFSEPMDYALLLRLPSVSGPNGNVTGVASVARHETQWRFVPDEPWRAGEYRLLTDTALEDLAGNRIDQPFDVDVFDPVTRRIERQTVSLPFRIGSQ